MKKVIPGITGMIIGLLFNTVTAICQKPDSIRIKGRVTDQVSRLPMGGVTIQVLNKYDSSVHIATVTDSNGIFGIIMLDSIPFFYALTSAGYQPGYYLSDPRLQWRDFTMTKLVTELKAVTVSSKRPTISYQNDKMIVQTDNIENSISGSAFDVLRAVPGVVIENEEKLQLNGKVDITILFNGRKQTLTVDQAIKLLKAMPASSLKQIEVTNAKTVAFDASGTGGILNFVTKAPLNDSYNINVNHTLLIDRKAASMHSVFVNFKQNKLQSFFSASFTNGFRFVSSQIQSFYTGTRPLREDDTFASTARSATPSLYASLDYELEKNKTIGVVVSSYFDRTENLVQKSSRFDPGAGDPYSILLDQQGKNRETLHTFDLVFSQKLDTLGSKFTLDAGYLFGSSLERPLFYNRYLDGNSDPIVPAVLIMANIPLKGHQYILQGDYEKFFGKRLQVSGGGKYTSGEVKNYVNYDSLKNGNYIPDRYRTDSLGYSEQVASFYLSVRHSKNKNSFQAGMRTELTRMENVSLTARSDFGRTFFNIFPNLSYSYNGKSTNHSLVVSTSINRPPYQSLNPYIRYIDDQHFQQGNANLRPGYAWTINSDNSIKDFLYLTVGYSYGKNAIFNVARQLPDTILTMITPYNALNYEIWYSTLSTSYELFKIWSGSLSISGNLMQYHIRPDYKTSAMDEKWMNSLSVSSSNTVYLTKKVSLEVGTYFYSGRRFYQNDVKFRWQMNGGFRYKAIANRLTIASSVSDIFQTMITRGKNYYDSFVSDYWTEYNTRRFRVSVTLNFGKLKNDLSKSGFTQSEVNRFKK